MPCRKTPLGAKRRAYRPTSKTIMPVPYPATHKAGGDASQKDSNQPTDSAYTHFPDTGLHTGPSKMGPNCKRNVIKLLWDPSLSNMPTHITLMDPTRILRVELRTSWTEIDGPRPIAGPTGSLRGCRGISIQGREQMRKLDSKIHPLGFVRFRS